MKINFINIFQSSFSYVSEWPSGLRRQTQGEALPDNRQYRILVLSEGVGSNPTSDILFFFFIHVV